MPDILHELSKGVWGHVKGWIFAFIKENGATSDPLGLLDKRFLAVPPYFDMKRFTKGPTRITGLTGRDEKAIMKVWPHPALLTLLVLIYLLADYRWSPVPVPHGSQCLQVSRRCPLRSKLYKLCVSGDSRHAVRRKHTLHTGSSRRILEISRSFQGIHSDGIQLPKDACLDKVYRLLSRKWRAHELHNRTL